MQIDPQAKEERDTAARIATGVPNASSFFMKGATSSLTICAVKGPLCGVVCQARVLQRGLAATS